MNIALLLSGGTGVRLGSNVPKQYIEISGCPVFSWCLEALAEHEDIIRRIENKDKERAAEIVCRHIDNQVEAVMDAIRTKKG